jgi:hypothetical protein
VLRPRRAALRAVPRMSTPTVAPTMTRGERTELAKLVRQRAKVAKDQAAQRAAELRADFEQQLAEIYKPEQDPIWKELHSRALDVVVEGKKQLAERCRELGIPESFATHQKLLWSGRGENASVQRRTELRAVATSRIDALLKTAKAEIERVSVEVQTRLVADGLTTAAAQQFLAEMPTVEVLMPRLDVSEIRGLLRNTA